MLRVLVQCDKCSVQLTLFNGVGHICPHCGGTFRAVHPLAIQWAKGISDIDNYVAEGLVELERLLEDDCG